MCSAFARHGKFMGSRLSREPWLCVCSHSSALKLKLGMDAHARVRRLDSSCVIAEDIKICTYCCYVRCAILTVRVGEIPLPQNRRNLLPCIVRTSLQRSCNQRVGCLLLYIVEWLKSMLYGNGLWTSPRCVVWSHVVVRISIKLKYRNTT